LPFQYCDYPVERRPIDTGVHHNTATAEQHDLHPTVPDGTVTSVKVVEIGVELEVAIGQAAMGGSLPISVSSRGGVSSAIASICM